MSKTKLLILFPQNFLLHPMSSPFQGLYPCRSSGLKARVSLDFLLFVPSHIPSFSESFWYHSQSASRIPPLPTASTVIMPVQATIFFFLSGLLDCLLVCLLYLFILSQYSQNNHFKMELYSLKTLTWLRGKFRDFTMIYKALHNLALATSEFLSHTVPSPPPP